MNQEKIGKFIKKIRKDNNLSQNEFASIFNVTYQAVSKWERGLSVPDISILREISKKFNVDIDDILDGEEKPKEEKTKQINKLLIIGIIVILVLLLTIILLNFKKKNDTNFEMKEIKTTCENFKVNGNVAYSSDKTTIIINNISFCDEDDTEYEKIESTLYEKDGNNEIVLSQDKKEKNNTLSSYLEDIKFKIEHISKSCEMFTKNELYIIINATKNNKTTTYKIPLKLDETCTYVELN